jgi:hypothetical protein
MHFNRVGNLFRVVRIAGPTHNLLGIEFGQTSESSSILARPPIGTEPSTLKPDLVQGNVLEGVAEANREFGTSFVVKVIEFVSDDSPPEETYRFLAYSIVERLSKGLAFGSALRNS